jgi:hypothetical protein
MTTADPTIIQTQTLSLGRRRAYKPTDAEREILAETWIEEMLVGRTLVRRDDKISDPRRKGGRPLTFRALVLGPTGLPKYVLARGAKGGDRFLNPDEVKKVRNGRGVG